ncbi:hypothetical protein Tco_1250632 [Tanacetum coccineum]
MINQQPMLLNQPEDITSLQGICNVSPNRVFGNEVYGCDSEGFGVNPLSNEFRFCNSDELWSTNGGGPLEIRGYGGGGDMVIIEFRFRGRLNQLNPSSYAQVMVKTMNSAIRSDLEQRLYKCRCEDTTECGYD